MKNGTIMAFLESARVLIENARDIPVVAQAVADYGYDSARIQEGVAALSAAQALVSKQIQEYGESFQATEVLNKAFDAAQEAYRKAVKVARVAFGDDADAGAALVLPGVRKETINGFLEQAAPFYGNLLGNPSFQARMGKFGYSPTRIQGEHKLVEAVRQAVNDQLKETGEARASTRIRDQALDVLDAWVSDFKAICRVALAEDPERLEQLGILVLNAPRRKAKETASA